jgi:hypothetical protein
MTNQTDYHPLCNDCGVDVLQSGDWYMTPPELWASLDLGWNDNLCVPCLEKRLGREVKFLDDILPIVISVGREHTLNTVAPERLSPRLMEIFQAGGVQITKTKQKRKVPQ